MHDLQKREISTDFLVHDLHYRRIDSETDSEMETDSDWDFGLEMRATNKISCAPVQRVLPREAGEPSATSDPPSRV